MKNIEDFLHNLACVFPLEERVELTRKWQKEIRQEYDKELRSAIEDYLTEHSDPKTEYGPHDAHIDWLHPEDVQEAIDKAEVKV